MDHPFQTYIDLHWLASQKSRKCSASVEKRSWIVVNHDLLRFHTFERILSRFSIISSSENGRWNVGHDSWHKSNNARILTRKWRRFRTVKAILSNDTSPVLLKFFSQSKTFSSHSNSAGTYGTINQISIIQIYSWMGIVPQPEQINANRCRSMWSKWRQIRWNQMKSDEIKWKQNRTEQMKRKEKKRKHSMSCPIAA
jgi:hypothetical protein